MKTVCKVCNLSMSSEKGIGMHLKLHNFIVEEYYNLYVKKQGEGLCICGKKSRFRGIKKDASIEVKLQKGLTNENINFKTHIPLEGQPDIFIEPDICIFADGNYWHNFPHGRNRDKLVTKILLQKGFKVLRFWESEINKNFSDCIQNIKQELTKGKLSSLRDR